MISVHLKFITDIVLYLVRHYVHLKGCPELAADQ